MQERKSETFTLQMVPTGDLLDTLLLITKRARHMMDARQILRILAHRKGKLKSKELNHI